MTVIVGEKTYAIEKIWELITIANQWTLYTAKVLSMISLNSNSIQEPTNFNFPDSYPFFKMMEQYYQQTKLDMSIA